MTRRQCLTKVASALGIGAAVPWLPSIGHAQDTASSLANTLESIRERHGVPGLAAAACISGELIGVEATGIRKIGDPAKATVADRWHIGSCTKSMTATLAGLLVEEGRLKWEDTVGKALGTSMKIRAEWQAVTLEQLLQHQAGAPAEPPPSLWEAAWKQNGSPTEQRRAFVEGLLKEAPVSAPGKRFEYSNQGYAIAGVMMESVTRKAWEDLLRARLFEPLQMKSAGFGAPGAAEKLDQPYGHTGERTLKPKAPGPSADNPPAIGPAGTVHCSITDLARYAAWHADEGRSTRWPLKLKPETFARLHTAPTGGDYACGWSVEKRGWAGGRVLAHNGCNTMWYAIMWVAPLKDAAFVAATNAATPGAAKATDSAVAELIGRFLKSA